MDLVQRPSGVSDYGSTGILTGGGLSIGTGGAGVATTFTIAAGTGKVVDPTTNPPTVTNVTWSAKTDVAVTNILTQLVTFVGLDSGGNVVQSATLWTPAQTRDYIQIGVAVHSNLTTVNAVNQGQLPLQSLGNQFSDLTLGLGTFNVSGNVFSANGANLKLNKSAGSVFRLGANYTTLTDNPHVVTLASLTQASLRMQNQTGAGGASVTDIDPSNYDVAGVTTAVPANKFTILRIFSFVSNLLAVQRGQAVYNSLAEAKAAIQTETYVTNAVLLSNGILRGFLVVRQGTTALNTATDAFFIETGRFGGSAGVGGLSVSTLQNVYDNSSNPEIVTDATRLGVTIRRGSGADTDVIFEGQNGAGSTTFSVLGNGTIAGLNLSGTNTGDITLGAIGAAPNANGATLAAQVLNLQPASAGFGGVVTTAAQSFAGAKSFQATLTLGVASTTAGILTFLNATNANTATIQSGVTSASYTMTLPLAQGAASTILTNDGAGALSWAAAAAGGASLGKVIASIQFMNMG